MLRYDFKISLIIFSSFKQRLMDIITDYYVVTQYVQDHITETVRHMIKEGWQPFGSLSTVLGEANDNGIRPVVYS